MFDAVTTEELRLLARPAAGHQVSISLPTHAAGPDRAQDPIRLRQLLDGARAQLVELGVRGPDADAFLAPAVALLGDANFWANTEAGLGVFINADGFRRYRFDAVPPARVVVSDRFQLRPLLPARSASDSFWVLALSQKDVRLLRGSRIAGLERVDLGDAPTSLEAALRFDDREPQMQSHATGRAGTGGVTASMHGQGGVKDTSDEERSRFCHIVDGGVRTVVGSSNEPVVLAGERRLLDDFRKASQLGHLVDREVVGNPDALSDRQVGEAVWDVVKDVLEQQLLDDAAAFGEAVQHRTSSLDETILAAVDGKVESLIVPLDSVRYARYAPNERIVVDWPVGTAGVGDAFDIAVAETLRHGGRVHAVAPGAVPGSGPVATRLRY